MEQRQLEYFKALYTNGNITQTAKELYLTRQALSLSIRKLEQEVGASLFTRTNDGLIPTDAAHLLYDYTQKQEQLWNMTLQQIRNTNTASTCRIALHIMYMHSSRMQKFFECGQNNGYLFSLTNITDSGQCQTLLDHNQVDLACTHKPVHSSKFTSRKLYDDETWLIMEETDPLAQKEIIDFRSDLKQRTIVFPSRETMKEVEPIILAQGGFCSLIESDRVLLQQSLVAKHAVVAIPKNSLTSFLQEGLVARKLTHFPVVNGLYFIYLSKRPELDRIVDLLAPIFYE